MYQNSKSYSFFYLLEKKTTNADLFWKFVSSNTSLFMLKTELLSEKFFIVHDTCWRAILPNRKRKYRGKYILKLIIDNQNRCIGKSLR